MCVEHILSALDHMSDDEKRRVLLKLKPDTQQGPQGTQEEPQEEGRRLGGARTAELEREVGGRPGEGQGKAGSREAGPEVEVVLRLHNTWGGTKAIGIEQVRCFGPWHINIQAGWILTPLYGSNGASCAPVQLCVVDASGCVLPLTRDDVCCRTGLVKKTVAATDKMVQVRHTPVPDRHPAASLGGPVPCAEWGVLWLVCRISASWWTG